MLYGNLKNCTYTQTTGNCSKGVGFFLAHIITKYNPIIISYESYIFVFSLALFINPGLVSTYKQIKSVMSLEAIDLNTRLFKTF